MEAADVSGTSRKAPQEKEGEQTPSFRLSPLSFSLPGTLTRWVCSSSRVGPVGGLAVGSHSPSSEMELEGACGCLLWICLCKLKIIPVFLNC